MHQLSVQFLHPARLALFIAILSALAGTPDRLAAQGATGKEALRPVRVLFPPGGPKVIRLSGYSSGLTALRLSFPVQEKSTEAGAAMILTLMGLERAQGAAAAVGARVEGVRTPWGMAYTVVGPSADFDQLAYVLREALAEPTTDRIAFERARSRVRGEAQRERVTASGRLAAELRAVAAPAALPAAGTPASLDMISMGMLRDLWARTHRPERMSLVLVGPEPVELVLASLRDIGPVGAPPPSVPTALPPSGPQEGAEVLRTWYGSAWVIENTRDPHGEVVASLIARRLRAEDLPFESRIELWYVGNTRVLAVTGAASGANAPAMRRRVDSVLPEGADQDEVAPAMAALRFDLLDGASTPWGLAGLVGRYEDATGDAYAAYQHMVALDAVTPETLGRYIRDLESNGPLRAEIRP